MSGTRGVRGANQGHPCSVLVEVRSSLAESRGAVMGAGSGASLVLEPPHMLSLANFLFKAGWFPRFATKAPGFCSGISGGGEAD